MKKHPLKWNDIKFRNLNVRLQSALKFKKFTLVKDGADNFEFLTVPRGKSPRQTAVEHREKKHEKRKARRTRLV